MTSSAVARLSAPADLVGVVPHLVGFVPTESVVLLALRGRRRRVRLTLRLDLPQRGQADAVARSLVARIRSLQADAVVALVYTEEPGPLARKDVVDALLHHCNGARLEVTEALLVRGGRYWSYTCSGPCCPVEGLLVPREVSGPVGLVQAETALSGRAVLSDRAELEATLRAPDDPELSAAFRAAESDPALARLPRADRRRLWKEELAAWPRSAPCPVSAVARLALSLRDVLVRDEVATWSLDEPERLRAVLHELAGKTPSPWDAPLSSVIAWTAYAAGDGGTANVALDRALRTDPQYSLALLLLEAIDGMVPPRQVRDLLRATAETLR